MKITEKLFDKFLVGIRKILTDQKYKELKNEVAGSLYFMLEGSITKKSHPMQQEEQKFVGIYKGGTSKLVRWEHAVPKCFMRID